MSNALAQERSAYLRQHQSNPVDWLPWGEPALALARELDKPILLSIGYSACHWCHVMARESFADVETAALMNGWFVNIKVDREERPDVDAIYIRALEAMGRRPGWPLTIFLTPGGKPYWGGTYFPPEERDGLPAFREVLKYAHTAYRSAPDASDEKGQQLVTELLARAQPTRTKRRLAAGQIEQTVDQLVAQVDRTFGGLKGAPKFPHPTLFRFLWNEGLRTNRHKLREAVILTLDRIALGGLFDHVGGGFFRYAVDERWTQPHFEKMLYDNALLISLYSEVFRHCRKTLYRDIVYRTIAWLMREMRLKDGGFASSLDAEEKGREGAYYCLTHQDLERALGPLQARAFFEKYLETSAVIAAGRVLNRSFATADDCENPEFFSCCDLIQKYRAKRSLPRRDDKLLADWNGLTITALAEASVVFDEPEWLKAAEQCFQSTTRNLSSGSSLHHSWIDGHLGSGAILDDYANMALAGSKLFEITGNTTYRDHAAKWSDYCMSHFLDSHGSFFYTPDTAKHLVARIRIGEDSVTPAGNGVMARVLSELYYHTGEDRYLAAADSLFGAFVDDIERDSFLFASILDAQRFRSLATQVTITGDRTDQRTTALWNVAQRKASADRLIRIVGADDLPPGQQPSIEEAHRPEPTACICVGSTCSLPMTQPAQLAQRLDEFRQTQPD
jgi:uncharacterized protein